MKWNHPLFSCSGTAQAWSQAFYGEGSGKVLLDEVQCSGNELSIEQCPKRPWGEHDCEHQEDAGVSCVPTAGRDEGTFQNVMLLNCCSSSTQNKSLLFTGP